MHACNACVDDRCPSIAPRCDSELNDISKRYKYSKYSYAMQQARYTYTYSSDKASTLPVAYTHKAPVFLHPRSRPASYTHAAPRRQRPPGADTPGKCEQEQEQEQEAPRHTPGPSTPVDWSRQMRALQSLTATVRVSARGVRKEI